MPSSNFVVLLNPFLQSFCGIRPVNKATPFDPAMAACSELMSIFCGMSQEYNNNKRRSRDIETETDDDLLVCAVWPWPGPEEVVLTASNKNRDSRSSRGSRGSLTGSISSSLSVHSDRNFSSDAVEEYVGDVPFAGKPSNFYIKSLLGTTTN